MDYQEHYRIDAEVFDYWGDDQFSPVEARRNQSTFHLAGIKPGEEVLDIGSGRGWFSIGAASRGAHVTALDLSPANLERIKRADERINTVLGDALHPPVPAGNFDLIVALEVLEHLVDPGLALATWRKLLKPEGRLLITVPYREVLRYSLCIHCNRKTPVNAHLHSFSPDSLAALLVTNGYQLREIRPFCHKLLGYLRLDRLLAKAPYPLWNALDRFVAFSGDKYNYLAASGVARKA